MSTSLLIHPSGASLVSLTKTHEIIARTPLALASRFPKHACPGAVVSERTGHVWIWSKESAVVWEYDARARRISEFSAGGKVSAICWVVTPGGRDCVVLAVGGEVKVMEKEGGKWDCVGAISLPQVVVALSASTDGKFIAMINQSGDLSVYDRSTEVRRTVPVPRDTGEISAGLMRFAPSLASMIILPTTSTLLLIDAETHRVTEINPSGGSKRILDIGFTSVQEGSDCKRRGGLCAVLLDGGEVALLGLDQPDSFGKDVHGVSFLDGVTIAAQTSTGTILLKDLRALADAPMEVSVSERVLGVHALPAIPRSSSRASLATGATIKRTPFGESSNSDNLPTPPPVPQLDKGKGKAKEIGRVVEISQNEVVQTAEIHIPLSQPRSAGTEGSRGERRASHTGVPVKSALKSTRTAPPEPQDKGRNVSAPIASASASGSQARGTGRSRVSLPLQSSRSASQGDLASGSRPAPRSSTLAGLAEVIEEEDEERQSLQDEGEEDTKEQIGEELGWALTSPTSRHFATAHEIPFKGDVSAVRGGEVGAGVIEDLRRDMWGFQMDMLRMNRSLKAEIRNAVEPLKAELEQSRMVIQAQKREIERLTRGY